MPTRLRRVLAATAAATALLLSLATPGHAASYTTIRTWHLNVAGHTLHDGSTTNRMTEWAAASIFYRDAEVATLNELCRQQYDAIVASLRARGWPQDPGNFARFTPQLAASAGACNGQDFGLAIFSSRPLGTSSVLSLPPDDRTEVHKLLCAPFTQNTRARVCNTHVTPSTGTASDGSRYNERQLQAVLDQLETWRAGGHTVVLSGDLNAQPHYGRLNGWYSSDLDTAANGDNTGRYRELDDADPGCPGYGEWTATGPANTPPCAEPRAKLDHTFVRADRLTGYTGDAVDVSTECVGVPATSAYPAGSCSDHRLLVGRVDVVIG